MFRRLRLRIGKILCIFDEGFSLGEQGRVGTARPEEWEYIPLVPLPPEAPKEDAPKTNS